MDAVVQGDLQAIVIRCMQCGNQADAAGAVARCAVCGGLLDVEISHQHPLDRYTFAGDVPPELSGSGVWRYRHLLPAIPLESIVTRLEGNTPIYRDNRLTDFAGVASLGLKHEGQNPTGSFKDRGMTVGVSHAKSIGARIVACASTGNTSASLASYAAAANMTSLVLIPEGKISEGKLAQTIAHGARIVQVNGNFDDALRLLRHLTDRFPVYLVNSVNPFRLEGQKTIVFEMLEQLGFHIPDVIVLPGGNLGNTAAFGKALADLWHAGLISTMPRLVTVQAAGAAPFVDYFKSGFDHYQAVSPVTVATAIKIGDPASVARARRSIEQTNGIAVAVTDDEIMTAKAEIDRAGIGCEPASAASLAGLRKLVAAGDLNTDIDAIAVLTGHLLKDADAVVRWHLGDDVAGQPGANRPVTIDADIGELERTLADALHS